MYFSNSDFSHELKIHGSNSLKEVSTHTTNWNAAVWILNCFIHSHTKSSVLFPSQKDTPLIPHWLSRRLDLGSLIAPNPKISPINVVSKIYLKSSTSFVSMDTTTLLQGSKISSFIYKFIPFSTIWPELIFQKFKTVISLLKTFQCPSLSLWDLKILI